MSPLIATHIEQPDSLKSAPASRKISASPSAIACLLIWARLHTGSAEAGGPGGRGGGGSQPVPVRTIHPELRDVGAGQAIDQLGLYGSSVKWFVEVGSHEPGRDTAIHHRALGCRAYWTAAGGRPGPVHLNFPLREPLAPVPEHLTTEDWAGRPSGRPWTELREHASAPHADDVHELAARP